MSQVSKLTLFIQGVGADIKALFIRSVPAGGTTGQVLTKTANGDYATAWQNPAAGGATINDTTPSGTSVYSSNKTDSQIATAKAAVKNEILGGAGAAYDTLQELRDILTGDENTINTLVTAVGTRVNVAAAQSFTNPQKIQGRQNIGAYGLEEIGDPETDLLAIYNAAKA